MHTMRMNLLLVFAVLLVLVGCDMKKEPTAEERIVAAYEKKHKDVDSVPMFSQVDLDVAEAASLVDAVGRKLRAGDVVSVNEMLSQAEAKIKVLLDTKQYKTASAYAVALKAFLKGNATQLAENNVRMGSLLACVDSVKLYKDVVEASDSMVKVYEHINDSAKKMQAHTDSVLAAKEAKQDSIKAAEEKKE